MFITYINYKNRFFFLPPLDSHKECVIDLDLVKLGHGGSVLGSSQFLLLPQVPHKILLASKVTQK